MKLLVANHALSSSTTICESGLVESKVDCAQPTYPRAMAMVKHHDDSGVDEILMLAFPPSVHNHYEALGNGLI